MKTKTLKKVLTVLLAIAMLVSVMALPVNADIYVVGQENTIQSWDFTGFADGTYTGQTDAKELISSDGKVGLGVRNAYWNCNKTWTAADSVMTFNSTQNPNKRHVLLIALTLDKDLKAGITYKLSTDMTFSLTGNWSDSFAIYYAPTMNSARADDVEKYAIPSDCTELYYKKTGFNAMPSNEFEFIPTTDLAAGGCITLRIWVNACTTATATVSEFNLTGEIPYEGGDGDAVLDDWDFTAFEDGTYTGQTDANELISSDGKVGLGVRNAYWNCNKTWTAADSVMTFNSTQNPNKRHVLLIALTLDKDLKAGITYKLSTDMTFSLTGNWSDSFAIYYAPTMNSARADDVEKYAIPSDCTELYYKKTGFNAMPSNEFEFTPTTDLAAGGCITLRIWVNACTTATATVSEFKLSTSATTTVRHYDFSVEADRNALIPTRTTSNIENYVSGDEVVGIKWNQGGIGFNDITFEQDKIYRITLEYGVWDARTLVLWSALKSDAVNTKAYKNELLTVPGTGNMNTKGTVSFDMYSRKDIDYANGYTPILKHLYSGGTFVIYSLTVSEYSTKLIMPDVAVPVAPVKENIYYKSMKLPEINTLLQEYAIANEDGTYTTITSDLTDLDYDTEYKIVVRYKDSDRYYTSAYSDSITVKTRKMGDVSGDGITNIIDLVRLKKGIVNDETSPVYDVALDDGVGAATDLSYLRRILLGIIK